MWMANKYFVVAKCTYTYKADISVFTLKFLEIKHKSNVLHGLEEHILTNFLG